MNYIGKNEIKLEHAIGDIITFKKKHTRHKVRIGEILEIYISGRRLVYLVDCDNRYNIREVEHDDYYVTSKDILTEPHKTVYTVKHPLGSYVNTKSYERTVKGRIRLLQFWEVPYRSGNISSMSMVRLNKNESVAIDDGYVNKQ